MQGPLNMTRLNEIIEACPRCKTIDRVKAKLMLIDRGDTDRAQDPQRSPSSECAMAVSDLKAEFMVAGSTGQFIEGLYCERCDLGYVPEYLAKLPQPRYERVDGGWRRWNADGTIGPVFNRISDDPDSRCEPATVFVGPVAPKVKIDRTAASRTEYELLLRYGRRAYLVAREWSESAKAAGELEAAQFWLSVSAGIRPRGGN